jgi:hypothetical protein
MMIRTALLALALSACAAPPAEHVATTEAGCDLKVEFASIGTGIDGDVLQKVDALLANDTGVAAVARERWGKEGEITLCVDTRTGADADRLFGQVKALFPATSQKPLRVERQGRTYQAPAP